jgi:hypothetical protein
MIASRIASGSLEDRAGTVFTKAVALMSRRCASTPFFFLALHRRVAVVVLAVFDLFLG